MGFFGKSLMEFMKPDSEREQTETTNSTVETTTTEEEASASTTEDTTTTEEQTETTASEEQKQTTATETTTEEETTTSTTENTTTEINDNSVLEYLRAQGREVESIEDLFKKPEAPNVVEPTTKYSDEVNQFLKYHEETGRSFQDYQSLNKDFSKASALDLAREKAISASKGKLSSEDVDEYLQKKLNIDLSDPSDLDKFDLIELETYSDDYRNQRISEQEQYRKPLEKQPQEQMITLANGKQVTQEEFQTLQTNQKKSYEKALQDSADSITASSFNVKVDNNGTEENYTLDYSYSKEDKHNMLSSAKDVDSTLKSLFGSEQGFDYKAFQEAMFWMNPANREKAFNAVVHKALAKQGESILRKQNNTNFDSSKQVPGSSSKKNLKTPNYQNPNPGTVKVKWDS